MIVEPAAGCDVVYDAAGGVADVAASLQRARATSWWARRSRTGIKRRRKSLIGFFVNMLALRTDLSGNPTFRELVQRVRETALGAYAHQALPFEKLIEELQPERDASHTPLVQVVFALQNAPQADLTALDLKLNYVEVETSTAKFDIVVNVYEIDDKLSIVFTYSTDLFDAASIQRLGQHFKALLAAVVENARQTDLGARFPQRCRAPRD